MRFRAKIINIELLLKLVQSVEKIEKVACLRLSPKKLELIVKTDVTDGVQVWSGVSEKEIFQDYRVESLAENKISLVVELESFAKALKTGQGATEIQMKLTKKNGQPYLCLIIVLTTTQSMTIMQDVPVQVLSPEQALQYQEPDLPEPDVYITMPPLKHIRTVIDRMKNLEQYLQLQANMAGELTLRVESEMVSVATFFRGLEHPMIEGQPPPRRDPERRATVKVDIKKFHKFLYSSLVAPQSVVCCIGSKMNLVLHVLLNDLFITYYIPPISGD